MGRLDTFLELVVKQSGSDLHMVCGEPPRIRIHGELTRVRFRELTADDMKRVLTECMDERALAELAEKKSVDLAYETPELGRFRVNVYHHINGLAATFRTIPSVVKTIAELNLPEVIAERSSQPRGLTLVTGPTGSGKSTTLAAIIDHINSTRRHHIITIEDPIEFVHPFKKSVVTQRQVGLHAPSFSEALRAALREDPNVVLVGEMRDIETIGLALTAAETGIQVLGTLHTSGAVRTVDRIVNVFPGRRQEQIRTMLADGLRMIVSQQLVRTTEGNGRVAALEILVNTPAAETIIRAGKTHQLISMIQTGAREGMRAMDAELMRLVGEGRINGEDAYLHALDKAKFSRFAASEAA
jgi:twitching motility protein PilT